MALAASLVGQGLDASATSVTTVGSVTRVANRLYFAVVYSYKSGGTPNTPSVTGFTQVATSLNAHYRVTLLRYLDPSPPAPGTITATFGGQSQTDCFIDIIEWTGADSSGTNGSGAIVQAPTRQGTDNRASLPLATFSDSANASFGCMARATASVTTTAGTELSDQQGSASAAVSGWEIGQASGLFFTWASLSYYAVIGVEVKTNVKTIAVGLASETDTAIAVAPSAPHQRQVGNCADTETAFAMSPQKRIPVAQIADVSSCLRVTPIHIYGVTTLTVEADTAGSLPLYPIT